MRKKKIIVFLLIAVCISCFIGCGKKTDGIDTETRDEETVTQETEVQEAAEVQEATEVQEDIEIKEDTEVKEDTEAKEATEIKEEEKISMTEKIEVFAQNSIRIRDRVGNIYIDPFRMEESPNDADIIFITHEHYDHYSPEDIGKVAGDNTVLVIPESMQDKVSEVSDSMKRILTVKPGTFHEVEGLEFETVPAYNTLKPYHPKSAGWVGYILRIDDKRIYIAGDTDATKDAKAVKCDIALVPIGGTYTMDAKKAAELVNEIRPETAIPVHYGSVVGSPEDADRFAENVKDPVKVEKKISFR